MISADRCPRSKTGPGKEAVMRRDDIVQTEWVSEIVLLTGGIAVVVTLIVAVLVALARIASLMS